MRVLVAGATGVIGRQLVPVLQGAGHTVIGLSRTAPAGPVGHETVAVDALDPTALRLAVKAAEPDAVVHLLTAIPKELNPRRIAADFALTNRLRTEATRSLIEAATEVGAKRFIAQGLAFAYRPGDGLADEDTPLWTDGPASYRPLIEALIELERLTAEVDGTVLRFGQLYGPGTVFAPDGSFTAAIRAGKMPLIGRGTSVFSFLHTRDAATAITAALDKPVSGAFNVVDDTPVPFAEWLPEVVKQLVAPRPKKVPAWLVRPVVGSYGVAFMTRLRGVSNVRARLELDWRPGYPSWRQGFAAELWGRVG